MVVVGREDVLMWPSREHQEMNGLARPAITDTITMACKSKRAFSSLNACHQPLGLHTPSGPLGRHLGSSPNLLRCLLVVIWQLLLEEVYGGMQCPYFVPSKVLQPQDHDSHKLKRAWLCRHVLVACAE